MGVIVGARKEEPPETAAKLLSATVVIWLEEPAEEVFQGTKSWGRTGSVFPVLSGIPAQGSTWAEISFPWLPFFQERRASAMKKWGGG